MQLNKWEKIILATFLLIARKNLNDFDSKYDVFPQAKSYKDVMWHKVGFIVGKPNTYAQARTQNYTVPATVNYAGIGITTDLSVSSTMEVYSRGFPGTDQLFSGTE